MYRLQAPGFVTSKKHAEIQNVLRSGLYSILHRTFIASTVNTLANGGSG
jgi:hypothetical protein